MPADLACTVRAALDTTGGDADRAAAQQRYMHSALPFRGLAVPVVRSTVRQAVRGHTPPYEAWQATIRSLWDDAEFREDRYAAIGVARAFPEHARAGESLELYGHLVVTGAWWDLVDEIAAHLVGAVLQAHPTTTAATLRSWARGEDLWLRRTAILGQLRSKEHTDRRLLVDVIEPNLTDREFFIRKAIGWALRQYAHLDNDAAAWVRTTVETYDERLSPLSRREALR